MDNNANKIKNYTQLKFPKKKKKTEKQNKKDNVESWIALKLL